MNRKRRLLPSLIEGAVGFLLSFSILFSLYACGKADGITPVLSETVFSESESQIAQAVPNSVSEPSLIDLIHEPPDDMVSETETQTAEESESSSESPETDPSTVSQTIPAEKETPSESSPEKTSEKTSEKTPEKTSEKTSEMTSEKNSEKTSEQASETVQTVSSETAATTVILPSKAYLVKVNTTCNVVTVYTYATSTGEYTVPVKAMICSTGSATPQNKSYTLPNNRWKWKGLFGNVYGQYATHITGNILFHSVPYTESGNNNSLEYWEYDKLGTSASAGCVRLTVIDAKWIYDNMKQISSVVFYSDSDPGPLGKPSAQKISSNETCRGWDPTDPADGNPWNTPQNPTPSTEPVTEPATQPATEPVTEPTTQPATEPVTEPATEPTTEPASEPATENLPET